MVVAHLVRVWLGDSMILCFQTYKAKAAWKGKGSLRAVLAEAIVSVGSGHTTDCLLFSVTTRARLPVTENACGPHILLRASRRGLQWSFGTEARRILNVTFPWRWYEKQDSKSLHDRNYVLE